MPEELFNYHDDTELILWDRDPEGFKDVVAEGKRNLKRQLGFMQDHPILDTIEGCLRFSNVGTIVGWIATENHAIAYSIHFSKVGVFVWVYKSACQEHLSVALQAVSEIFENKADCRSLKQF